MATRPLIREARKSAGLTQHQLADRLGLAQATLARYETGSREPRVRAAVRLSEALDTTVNALWPPDKKPRRPRQRTRGTTTSEEASVIDTHPISGKAEEPEDIGWAPATRYLLRAYDLRTLARRCRRNLLISECTSGSSSWPNASSRR